MNIEKLRYSKCPACKKHGIPAFSKLGRWTYTVKCKYCHKKFKVNSVLAYIVKLGGAIGVGLFCRFVASFPFWLACVIGILMLFLFEYFAPLEEVDDQ